MVAVNNLKIARNTVFLYARTVLALLIALYTSRVLLRLLGDADYGIFSLVAGFATLFTFLKAGTGSATVRYLAYGHGAAAETAEGSPAEVFAASLRLHLYIAGGMLLVGETIGLGLVNMLPDLPAEAVGPANVAYQATLISAVFAMVEMPYVAAVLAREYMGAYAVLALTQAVLRLAAALALGLCAGADNLIVYSAFYAAFNIAASTAWVIYGRSHMPECRAACRPQPRTMKALLGFASYDSVYNAGTLTRRQGVLVIVNAIGGAVLNASAALALQVSSAATQLGEALVMAFRPQIVGQYAAGAREASLRLLYNCCRWTLVLLGMICIPLLLDTEYIMLLWLGSYPPYTVAFTRLCIVGALLEIMLLGLTAGVHATGSIGRVSIGGGILLLVELPLIVAAYVLTAKPEAAFAVHPVIIPAIMCLNLRQLCLRFPGFRLGAYLRRCVLSPVAVLAVGVTAAMPLLMLAPGFGRLCLLCVVSIAVAATASYLFLLSGRERSNVLCHIFTATTSDSDPQR